MQRVLSRFFVTPRKGFIPVPVLGVTGDDQHDVWRMAILHFQVWYHNTYMTTTASVPLSNNARFRLCATQSRCIPTVPLPTSTCPSTSLARVPLRQLLLLRVQSCKRDAATQKVWHNRESEKGVRERFSLGPLFYLPSIDEISARLVSLLFRLYARYDTTYEPSPTSLGHFRVRSSCF